MDTISERYDAGETRYFAYGNYLDEVVLETFDDGTSSSDYYYAHDHLYSPVALVSGSGSVLERYAYDVYGKRTVLDVDFVAKSPGSGYTNIGFTGQRIDILDNGNLTINYYKNRWYDAETGRFMSHDPLGIVPSGYMNRFILHKQFMNGVNIYQYVGSSPTIRIDHLGMAWWWPPDWGETLGDWAYYKYQRSKKEALEAMECIEALGGSGDAFLRNLFGVVDDGADMETNEEVKKIMEEIGNSEDPPSQDEIEALIKAAANRSGKVANDKFSHCYMSCRIAQECGPGAARTLGMGKETVDLVRDLLVLMVSKNVNGVIESEAWDKYDKKWADHEKDFTANEVGIQTGENSKCPDDCKKACEAAYGSSGGQKLF